MTILSDRLNEYLALRRSLGFDLAFTERVLRTFIRYAESSNHCSVTTALFLAWREDYGSADDNTWAARLGMVRGFATWLQGYDGKTEVPSSGLISGRTVRPQPYIYRPQHITQLVTEAGRLPSAYGLRGLLYQTLFGLIAVTGLRVNEALHLTDLDVDMVNGLLSIRKTKNGRDRFIPITPCTVAHLKSYACERDRLLTRQSDRFFLKEDRKPVGDCSARYNFAQVSQRLEFREPQMFNKHGIGPRIHDLRHSFAVHTILDWFREGRDIDREMYRLSTYLGHVKPEHTYWYIEAVPELLRLASERAERRCREAEK